MVSRVYPLAFMLAVLLGPGPAEGCAIPVFRYALERWPAAPYDLVVFHRGALTDPDRSVLRRLEQPGTAANVNVTPVDLAKDLDPDMQKLWESCPAGTRLPWLAVRAPDPDENGRPLFTGPLIPAEAEAVLDSPVRRQLVERLTAGESVIFVLLTGDDPAEDEAAARLLDRELPRLQARLRLPEPSDDGPPLLSPLPLRLSFTTLRLPRRDAREQRLIRMLLHGDDDLAKVRGPIVFPVFGRGRVLSGLHGPKLTAACLEEEAAFLCGACSCRVKELNPGSDLLLTADWNARLGIVPAATPDVSSPVEPVVEAVVPEPEAPVRPAVAAPAGPPEWLRTAIAVAVGLVVVTGWWAWVSGRAARR